MTNFDFFYERFMSGTLETLLAGIMPSHKIQKGTFHKSCSVKYFGGRRYNCIYLRKTG